MLLLHHSDDLIAGVTQAQLVHKIATLHFLAVGLDAIEAREKLSFDRIQLNVSVFETQKNLLLIYEDEGFWCLKIVNFLGLFTDHVDNLEGLVPVFDQ